MPLLSFVLVAHREQAFVERCAASLLADEDADLELVAIDDASPDHTPALLDALAERDGRVRVHHLAEHAGLGVARNAGLDRATGEYVWFVEASDVAAEGSPASVLERLDESSADVLLLDHTRIDVLGRSRPGPQRKLLARLADRAPGPLDELPGAARMAPHAWNKVFRHDRLVELGARFANGRHGELPVTWPALLAADRIAALAEPAYTTQETGRAAADESSPFDVFARYDDVFASADARGVPAARRELVAPAMLRHQLALLERVPASDRREFFRRISDAYSRHGGGAVPPADRVERLRTRLVARGDYAAFEALGRSLAARRRLARRGRAAGARARRARLERYYRSRLREPIDPDLAVFAAYWYRDYSCNPRAIYEKARELVPGMRGVWVVKPEGVASLPPGVDHVVAGSAEYYDAIARAGYLVNNVNFPNHLVKRPGSKHVMTHHGTPLKRMGLDLRDAPGSRTDFAALLRRCARWDFSVSQNVHTTLIWERVYPGHYESLESGYPRNDMLARATEADATRIRAELGVEPGRRTVLYAPTHREYQSDYAPTLDLAALADGLGDDWVVLARIHYFHGSDPLLRRLHREGRLVDVAGHPSIEELCIASDALITDYSSLMFDYAVLDRPIVIHAPDLEVYRAMRGTYFDLEAEAPGPFTRSDAETIDALRSGAADGEESRAARTAFRARFCSLDDGGASERVVRRVWLGEPLPAAPLVQAVPR